MTTSGTATKPNGIDGWHADQPRRSAPPTTGFPASFSAHGFHPNGTTWDCFRIGTAIPPQGHENAPRGRFRPKPGHAGNVLHSADQRRRRPPHDGAAGCVSGNTHLSFHTRTARVSVGRETYRLTRSGPSSGPSEPTIPFPNVVVIDHCRWEYSHQETA